MKNRNIFFWSDQHFSHENILKFKNGDNLIRPGFTDVNHMNETMIDNYCKVVRPEDKCYFLGDICFSNKVLHSVMPRLKGEKILILGNHDNLRMDEYYKYFKRIYSWRFFGRGMFAKTFVICHYPLHADSFVHRGGPNQTWCVHGHIHEKTVMNNNNPDLRYVNVSVEKTNYAPVHVEDLMQRMLPY